MTLVHVVAVRNTSIAVVTDSHLLFRQVAIVLQIFPESVKTANATYDSSHYNTFGTIGGNHKIYNPWYCHK